MADADGPGGPSQRASERQLLPIGMSANLQLASGEKIVVTLRDLSTAGVCAVRNGPGRFQEDAQLTIELIDYDRGQRLEVPASVRWVKPGRFSTMLGLQFEENGEEVAPFIAEHRGGGSGT